MPLPKCLQSVGERIVEAIGSNGEPPYQLYVYPPSEEYAVRADLKDLQLWLGARNVACQSISLAELFWAALEHSGWIDSVIEQEKQASGDPRALDDVYRSIGEILRQPPTLPDRVIAALDEIEDRTAVFLYRAGALYPAYRTSALLDDLKPRLRVPVTLLYPGTVVGEYGLKFMGRWDPAYGYRARIVVRGEAA
ncbi:MAG TPA: BREX protein BrxB domain-containing protein [Actinomycetota bacterium]|nr:BREX protein BrxB domain-containing protein [Actinomycetota bacterium]